MAARSEMHGDETGKAASGTVPPEPRSTNAARTRENGTSRLPTRPVSRGERDRMVKDARETGFPIGMRGYDRAAVNRYVEQVNRLIAELEISSSPEAAIRHALDEVSDETRDLLQRAHDTAEDITARSRSKADDRLQVAEREAQELREVARQEAEQTREMATREAEHVRDAAANEAQQLRATAQRAGEEIRTTARAEADEVLQAAETRARELARNAENVWRERRRLIEDMRAVGDQLVAIGELEASKRFARFAEDGEQLPEPSAEPSAEQPSAAPPAEVGQA